MILAQFANGSVGSKAATHIPAVAENRRFSEDMYADFKKLVRHTPLLFFLHKMVRNARMLALSPFYARAIASYLSSDHARKLQIGTGENPLDGWLNTDLTVRSRGVVPLDARRRFRFPDATFHYIFSEHQIEQLFYTEAQLMLKECYRVLLPGGKIRIATASLETLLALYTPNKTEDQEQYINWIRDSFFSGIGICEDVFVINNGFNGFGHRFLYDYDCLRCSLEAAGFVNVTGRQPEESEDQSLRGIESHGSSIDNKEMAHFETIVLEAMRPLGTIE